MRKVYYKSLLTAWTILAVLACVAWRQTSGLPAMGSTLSGGFPALTLGVHANQDNGVGTATTVAVGPITPAAGSTIVCGFSLPNASTFTSVTDNVNTGSYFPAASMLREFNHNWIEGIYYHENVANSATTITLTYTTTGTHSRMACAEIIGVPTRYALDSSFIASQALAAANPTTGTTLTPFGNGRFLYALVEEDSGTISAGSTFTLLDGMTTTAADQLVPEYVIQTTATATAGPYTNASGADYSDQMSAFAPNHSGTCGVSAIVDWGGGTASVNPAAADLLTSQHGNYEQPNADRSPELGFGSIDPGLWTLSTSSIIYSTAAYAPFVNTVTCPFYTGTGTNAGTLGLDQPTSNTGLASLSWYFDTPANVTTVWTCMETTAATGGSATNDVLAIARADNSDYANIQWNNNGGGAVMSLEAKIGGTVNGTAQWASNTWYGFLLTFNGNAASNHSLSWYSYSGSQCTGTPTLKETLTSGGGNVGPANTIHILGTSANTYASGSHFYMGALKIDYLYGATLGN